MAAVFFLMSSKASSIRKRKAYSEPNAESSTTKAILAGDTEGDAISRHIQNVHTPERMEYNDGDD